MITVCEPKEAAGCIASLRTRTAPPADAVERVRAIIAAVRTDGDSAVREFTYQFDGVDREALRVSPDESAHGAAEVTESVRDALKKARSTIEAFHATQREESRPVETAPGVECWRRSVPIDQVGIYVPGGSAPLVSSLLMLAVPAKLAGCKRIVVCSPPARDGRIAPVILWLARELGLDEIYAVGGAQAIAALAFGTSSIPAVDKICGPGNLYVTIAKQQVGGEGVAIDMPAGPSEVLVIADDSANPAFVASDLLAQAEHGTDSQAVLVTTSEELISNVRAELAVQLDSLPRARFARESLGQSALIRVEKLEDAFALSNSYAPEHLIVATREPERFIDKITCAGSVFLGHLSAEPFGDYASGPNHTLPTSGWARSYSGVSLDTFVKKITFQTLDARGVRELGRFVEVLADAEGLEGHRRAVALRRREVGDE